MATADTAKLIASLELKDGFSKPLNGINRALAGFDAKLTNTQGRAYKAGQQIGTGIRNGAKIAAIGIGLVTTQVLAGLRQLANLETVTVATNTVLKSTRAIAGLTADGIRKLSERLENLNATMDDKVIQSGANLLLTFTNIRKQAFEPALVAALNLNEAMGGGEEGLQKTIIQVGKALNDPAKGFTALKRVGVSFTEQQIKQIKALQKSGDLLGAQKIILAELGTEFGGRFAADGKTATATIAGIGDAVEDLQKGLATALFPTVQRLLPKVRELLASPAFTTAVATAGDRIAALFSEGNIAEGGRIITGLFKAAQEAAPIIQNAAEVTGRVVKTAVDLFRSLPPELQTLAVAGLAINKLTGGLVTNLAGGLISAVLSGFKGLMTVNAGVVHVNGAISTGGGVPDVVKAGTGAAGSIGLGALGASAAIAAVPLIAAGITLAITGNTDPTGARNLAGKAATATARGIPDWNNKALIELRRIQATGDHTQDAIERLRGSALPLLRRTAEKDMSTSVSVTVPVTTNINGRLIGAALTRYTTSVGNLGAALNGGGMGGQ